MELEFINALNDMPVRRTILPLQQALCLPTADVRRFLLRLKSQKAAGPDSLPGRVTWSVTPSQMMSSQITLTFP